MNDYEIYDELMSVKDNLQDIKTHSDNWQDIDIVTKAQYAILDTMAKIIEPLVNLYSCRCYDRERAPESNLTEDIDATYIPGEDKTMVWRKLYLNGECIVEELTGWYHGEPNQKTTEEYSYSKHTAYFTW